MVALHHFREQPACHRVLMGSRYFGAPPSFGADPANRRRPSGSVMVEVLAVGLPFRACHPSAVTTVPGSRSSLRQPRRYSEFAVAVSNAHLTTLPSVSTSM